MLNNSAEGRECGPKRRWLFGAAGTSTWSLSGLLGKQPKRISKPGLVRRTLHIGYDPSTGRYEGVPPSWRSEFFATPPPVVEEPAAKMTSSGGKGAVWFDQCSRRFVNLPEHWRERLQRNSLADWSVFQRNPALLTTVFTLMDEELTKMDLAPLGLDASFYSSDSKKTPAAASEASKVATTAASTAASTSSTTSTTKATATTAKAATERRIVWTQQRSFTRDDDSDSEEFAEL